MAKKKPEKQKDEISFEESFEALKTIVGSLEDGDLSLGQSLKNYESGIQRLKECYAALNNAEQKIRQLADIDENGNLVASQFESGSGDSAKFKKSSRSKSQKAPKESNSSDELF